MFPGMENLIKSVWTRRPKFKTKSYSWVHRTRAAFLNRKFRLSKIHSKLRSPPKCCPLTAFKTRCWTRGVELQVKIYPVTVDRELESQRIQVRWWLQTVLPNSDIQTSWTREFSTLNSPILKWTVLINSIRSTTAWIIGWFKEKVRWRLTDPPLTFEATLKIKTVGEGWIKVQLCKLNWNRQMWLIVPQITVMDSNSSIWTTRNFKLCQIMVVLHNLWKLLR